MREIAASQITDVVERLCIEACQYLPEDVKTAMSEIEVEEAMLQGGHRLMDIALPENTLVVLIKRGGTYQVPTGSTKLQAGDKLLVISDNEEELVKTYNELGVQNYYIEKNS